MSRLSGRDCKAGRIEVAQGFKDVQGAELEGSMVELGGIKIGGKADGGLLAGADFGKPRLFEKPDLVATLFPF